MVRLGRISYVNMAPVFHRLNAEVEEVQGVPTELPGEQHRGATRPGHTKPKKTQRHPTEGEGVAEPTE